MNFELSEEQQLLQQTVRQFLENECPATQLRAVFEGETGFDPALWKGMVEMGLAGLHLPERFGGAGLEMIDLALGVGVAGLGRRAGPVPRARARGARDPARGQRRAEAALAAAAGRRRRDRDDRVRRARAVSGSRRSGPSRRAGRSPAAS